MSTTSPLQLQLFDGSAKPASPARSLAPQGSPARNELAQRSPGRNVMAPSELEPSSPSGSTARNRPSRNEALAKAEHLAFRLSSDLGMPVRLSVTDNRSTMVSFRRASNVLRLRLHHMFLEAPEHVVQAVADYAGRGQRRSGTVLDEYIRGRQPLIRNERVEGESDLEPRGRCFNLKAMFDRINDEHFQGGIQATIGWGRFGAKRRRRSIRLGVYDHQTREIRIHPALDRPEVPAFFVEFIVFHEMLHQLFPSHGGSGRRVHHPPAFRAREKSFPLYRAAIAWERQNLRMLLSAR